MISSTTIAAIATPPGMGGIAVIRISGPQAFAIADRVVATTGAPPSRRPSQTFLYGHVHAPGDASAPIDEVIVLLFHAPRSYTREDVVEIQCHGGRAVSGRLLQAVLDAGASPAPPGEFTRRAFLNGRLDLVQAEAVMDLIRSETDHAAEMAMQQLSGNLSNSLSNIYDSLLQVAVELEATLDFSEDELPATTGTMLVDRIAHLRVQIETLLATWNEGHLLRDGALVAICGRPNAGKSTLMNALLGTDRAIVTHVPGTTRDTLEERLDVAGVPVRLVDTAGLRDATCIVEQAGIARARQSLDHADILLWVIDASQPLTADERAFLEHRDPSRCIVVFNKCDLAQPIATQVFDGYEQCRVCLLSGDGLRNVKDALARKLGLTRDRAPHAAIANRHRDILIQALYDTTAAGAILEAAFESHAVEAADHVRQAMELIGTLLGRHYTQDLLDRVFSQFCIGK